MVEGGIVKVGDILLNGIWKHSKFRVNKYSEQKRAYKKS